MSKLDDLFRDGLGARKAEVPNTDDLWGRINAAKNAPLPAGEELDDTFRNALRDRQAPVPAGMWARIAAARNRRPLTRWFAAAAALLLLLAAGGIGYKMTGSDPVNTTFVTTTVAHDAEVAEPATNENNTPDQDASLRNDNPLPAGAGLGPDHRIAETRRVNPAATADVAPAREEDIQQSSIADSGLPPEGALPPASVSNRPTATVAIQPLAENAVIERIETDFSDYLPEVTVTPGKFRSTSALRGLQTELLFGVSYANQQLTAANDGASLLRELRSNSEFPVAGYQITLRTTHRFNDRLRLLAGLTYAEIRNELDYDRVINGETVRLSTNNHIRMLEAPVLAGYTIPGRRMNVTVNAGPVINLTTSARGRFLDPNSALPLDLATAGNLRRNVGLGFMTSLTTAYQIGKERPFTLLIEPFFKAYPTAFTVKGAPLRENYWVAGLQIGVRKRL